MEAVKLVWLEGEDLQVHWPAEVMMAKGWCLWRVRVKGPTTPEEAQMASQLFPAYHYFRHHVPVVPAQLWVPVWMNLHGQSLMKKAVKELQSHAQTRKAAQVMSRFLNSLEMQAHWLIPALEGTAQQVLLKHMKLAPVWPEFWAGAGEASSIFRVPPPLRPVA